MVPEEVNQITIVLLTEFDIEEDEAVDIAWTIYNRINLCVLTRGSVAANITGS